MRILCPSNLVISKKQKLIIIYVFFTLALANSTISLYGSFVALIILFSFYFLFFGIRLRIPKGKLQAVDLIPLLYVLDWFYGVTVGLLRGIDNAYVFSNFAGFVTYLAYYVIIWSGVRKIAIFNILMISGLIVSIINIAFALAYFMFSFDVWNEPIVSLVYGTYVGGSSTGQVRMYNPSQLVALPLFSVALIRLYRKPPNSNQFIEMKAPLVAMFYIILTGTVTIVMPASKGFMLAILFVLFVSFSFWANNKNGKINVKNITFAILFAIILNLLLALTGYVNIVYSMFAENDEGNVIRYLQLSDLIDDMSFIGQGLGAVVPGNIRDEERPYGFELSYINMIHKLGFMSLLAIIGYLLSIIKIIYYGKSSLKNLNYAAAALGGMGFVFVGVGNPVISSPQLILLHCLSLLLIRNVVESKIKINSCALV